MIVKLGIAEYLTTGVAVADVEIDKYDRRYILVDAKGHPVVQRLHGDRYMDFMQRDLAAAIDWARQITEGGLATFVVDKRTGKRMGVPG